MNAITRDQFLHGIIPETQRVLIWWAVQIYRPAVAFVLGVGPKDIQVTAAAWDHAERTVDGKLVAWLSELVGGLSETIGADTVAEYQMRAHKLVIEAVMADASEILKGAKKQ